MLQTLKTPKGYIYTVYIAAGRIAFCSSLYRQVSDSSGVRWVAV